MKILPGHENYTAQVIKVKEYRKHPQADRLYIVNVNYQNVITGVEPIIGQNYVYFPVLAKINFGFLSKINGFRDNTLNNDTTQRGFFEKNCRVKPIKLRGLKSEGYLHPAEDVGIFLGQRLKEGDEFNEVNGIVLSEKYMTTPQRIQNKPKQIASIISNQYSQHIDTSNLRRYITEIQPSSEISITYKLHGTSGISGRLLVKKKLNWFQKMLRLPDSTYSLINSSRRVIKSIGDKTIEGDGYYNEDIWTIVGNEISEKIPEGYTLYFEIVGQLPNGKWIQKPFDYGTSPLCHTIYIYRITHTTKSGFRIELSDLQIREFCEKFGLKVKPILFLGKAEDLYNKLLSRYNIEESSDWHQTFLTLLEKEYTEKDCYLCANKVPEEGIVLRENSLFEFKAWKLKSFKFLEYEDKALDNNENIEE